MVRTQVPSCQSATFKVGQRLSQSAVVACGSHTPLLVAYQQSATIVPLATRPVVTDEVFSHFPTRFTTTSLLLPLWDLYSTARSTGTIRRCRSRDVRGQKQEYMLPPSLLRSCPFSSSLTHSFLSHSFCKVSLSWFQDDVHQVPPRSRCCSLHRCSSGFGFAFRIRFWHSYYQSTSRKQA